MQYNGVEIALFLKEGHSGFGYYMMPGDFALLVYTAQPQPSGNIVKAIADEPRAAILTDSSYISGLRTGYVLGQAGNEEAYQMIITNTRTLINEARADLRSGSEPSGNAGELQHVVDRQIAAAYQAGMDGDEFDVLATKRAISRAAQAQPPVSQPTAYKGSKPDLHVGESSFESWWAEYLLSALSTPGRKAESMRRLRCRDG